MYSPRVKRLERLLGPVLGEVRSNQFMDEHSKYREMVESGANAAQIYVAAKADGLGKIESIKLIRELFQLSLADAIAVVNAVDGVTSQKRLPPNSPVLQALRAEDERDGSNQDWRWAPDVWVWCSQCERVFPADNAIWHFGRDEQHIGCAYPDCDGGYFDDGYNYARLRSLSQLGWPEVPVRDVKYKLEG